MTIDYRKLMHWKIPIARQHVTPHDCMLYALGIGLGANPLDRDELHYVYEEGLRVLPTMAAVLAYPGFWMKLPETGIDWTRVVHAEQQIVLHRPLPVCARLIGDTRIVDIVDKGPGKGALIYQERVVTEESSGEPICTLRMTTMCRGDGGVEGMPSPASAHTRHPAPVPLPETPPDFCVDLPILPQAALIYRLSGDTNPLHADPDVAQRAGFDRPILHGLCTFGIAGHAILKTVCWLHKLEIKSIGARFSAPVFPGETLRTEIWRRDAGRIAFRCSVPERDVVVLNFGQADIAPHAADLSVHTYTRGQTNKEKIHAA
ncbi:3-alpha,7-alpha,12-alpha-trihydroxy-5-beta-cholest-24-enoyl-CoA hydratase [Herbaspirillum sp. meg3]|uniref:MaoC/PaaZ C-terminal domain-containing protein n=1 Tax=Herbaspirillum sp. meg3 TaxID=2025949 RepID=UPI000B98C6B4|nr:MaoC/PaaZ C-terminal domain-containing protein [Herbaspirillum sp. meg3]ASU40519.1 3-alpha,7-alpha,12-alpha-trihydroxy-5-beta-cholest-24-enoyl-CoA hydratase [Herbaspirillum sp. meg3]